MTSSFGCCSSWLSNVERSTGAVKVSTSPTTVTVTTPSSLVEVESVITSSKGASVPSFDTSGCPAAGRSEVVTDSAPLGGTGTEDRPDNLPLCGPGHRSPVPRVVERGVGEGMAPTDAAACSTAITNVDTVLSACQPAPGGPLPGRSYRRSAVDDVDGALL